MKTKTVNFPNILSASRTILSIPFSYLLLFIKFQPIDYYLLLIFIAIAITDILDGQIARKTGKTTTIGAQLDIFADMFYLTSSYITLVYLKIIPLWFLIFLTIKFIEFILTSKKVHTNKKESKLKFDKIGKYMAISSMALPGIIVMLNMLQIKNSETIIFYIIILTTLTGITSLINRVRDYTK